MTSAELCCSNGWKVGDVLQRVSDQICIKLTAIGKNNVLACLVSDGVCGDEYLWSLLSSSWKKCEPVLVFGSNGAIRIQDECGNCLDIRLSDTIRNSLTFEMRSEARRFSKHRAFVLAHLLLHWAKTGKLEISQEMTEG